METYTRRLFYAANILTPHSLGKLVEWKPKTLISNRSGGDQKNVQYEITRNQYENQSRLDLYRIIVSSQKCYTGLQIVF